MGILDLIRSRLVFADGGFGSLLIERGFPGGVPEEWNLSHPDAVESIHADYFRAGSDYVHANAFGSTRVKLAGEGVRHRLDEVVRASAGEKAQMAVGEAEHGNL